MSIIVIIVVVAGPAAERAKTLRHVGVDEGDARPEVGVEGTWK